MRTKRLYGGRRYYNQQAKELFAKVSSTGAPNYIDLWDHVPLYGKVSPTGHAMIPEENLMRYNLGGSNLAAMPWVYEAVIDFQQYLNRANTHGRTDLNTLFGDFRVATSYNSPFADYLNRGMNIIAAFNETIYTKANGVVESFDDYVKQFVRYVGNLTEPFTFVNYFLSSKVGIPATGLTVAFDTLDANDDSVKNKYFQNPEFDKYVQSAANFGLRVDLHAPWRLVADLNSKPMGTYLLRHNIPSIEALFERYYTRAINYEISAVAHMILRGYGDYQSQHQFGIIKEYCISPNVQFTNTLTMEVLSEKQHLIEIPEYTKQNFRDDYGLPGTLRILEALKRGEQRKSNPKTYRHFKEKFDRLTGRPDLEAQMAAATLLEQYYMKNR